MAKPRQLKLEEKPEATTINSNDKISTLPESLLCHILSFLPTKEVVATSLLSRRWRNRWKDLQVLNFSYSDFKRPACFPAFVNRVLARRNASHIQKFCLWCDTTEQVSLSIWIDAAVGPHLQELYLCLFELDEDAGLFCLPHSVFTCISLVSLTLKGEIYLDDLSFVHLPSLKYLKLDIVCYDPIDEILLGCPVLETLALSFYENSAPTIRLPPWLKSFTFEGGYDCHEIENIEIDGPSLEFIDIKIRARCLRVLLGEFPNVVEAHLDIHPTNVNAGWVSELLKAFYRTKLLVLEASTIKSLLHAPALEFPEFCHLIHLRLGFPCFNSKFLTDLLHNCHMLQVLKIFNMKGAYMFGPAPQSGDPKGWTQPFSVPNCVTAHLKFFELKGYQDSADEHAFTTYILQRGLVLKIMTIHTGVGTGQKKKDNILNKLSIIPRGSSLCQLKLD